MEKGLVGSLSHADWCRHARVLPHFPMPAIS
jgi:hypothetical protein